MGGGEGFSQNQKTFVQKTFYACYDVRGMLLGETCAGDFNCTYNGMVFCGHIPCPLEPCAVQLVLTAAPQTVT
ncbi:hypothetical protein MAR_031916 [Mya arenaria]|uniref:Uncharacterized protein n=1 Tax=Mya arenaria TaxID=6604 RepID=A0ABY7F8H5_MYAAR|nr:hypothetical protein MAR_031916 [Mya arenaria]